MFRDTIHRWLRIPYTLKVHKRAAKKPRATVLFIHGIGASGAMWQEVITRLPANIEVLSIDLLGFGDSPRPSWAVYSAKTQARSVIATLLKYRPKGRVIIVGHSLGALVAVEVAKRYPLLIRSLILCSPPFYSNRETKFLATNPDKLLKRLYARLQKSPDQIIKLSELALKYKLANKAFSVNEDTIETYTAALESTIINQTSLEDAKQLKQPGIIIHGAFDPVVIRRNLKEIVKQNPQFEFKQILAGHEIKGQYTAAVAEAIASQLSKK